MKHLHLFTLSLFTITLLLRNHLFDMRNCTEKECSDVGVSVGHGLHDWLTHIQVSDEKRASERWRVWRRGEERRGHPHTLSYYHSLPHSFLLHLSLILMLYHTHSIVHSHYHSMPWQPSPSSTITRTTHTQSLPLSVPSILSIDFSHLPSISWHMLVRTYTGCMCRTWAAYSISPVSTSDSTWAIK